MTTFDDRLAATIAHARRHTLGDLVRRTAGRVPDKTAIVYGDLRQSYADLDATINRTANALAERRVVRGNRIALLSHNNYAYVVTCLALARLGAVTVPVNFGLGAPEVAFISNIRAPSAWSSRTCWCRSRPRRWRQPAWSR